MLEAARPWCINIKRGEKGNRRVLPFRLFGSGSPRVCLFKGAQVRTCIPLMKRVVFLGQCFLFRVNQQP